MGNSSKSRLAVKALPWLAAFLLPCTASSESHAQRSHRYVEDGRPRPSVGLAEVRPGCARTARGLRRRDWPRLRDDRVPAHPGHRNDCPAILERAARRTGQPGQNTEPREGSLVFFSVTSRYRWSSGGTAEERHYPFPTPASDSPKRGTESGQPGECHDQMNRSKRPVPPVPTSGCWQSTERLRKRGLRPGWSSSKPDPV